MVPFRPSLIAPCPCNNSGCRDSKSWGSIAMLPLTDNLLLKGLEKTRSTTCLHIDVSSVYKLHPRVGPYYVTPTCNL